MPPAHAPAEEKDIASDGGDASDVRLTPESPPVMASASDTTAPSATATAAVTSATRPPAADAAPADGAEADPGGNGNHGDAELESEAVTVNVVLPDAKKEDDSIVFPLLPTDCVQDIRHFVAEYPQAYIHTAFYFEFAGERCDPCQIPVATSARDSRAPNIRLLPSALAECSVAVWPEPYTSCTCCTP